MQISFAIVNCTARLGWGLDLYQQLSAEGDETTIAVDVDNEGAEANHVRALSAFDPRADWHCVIEDDAALSSEFHPRLREALEAYPDHIVSLYCGRAFPRHRQPNFLRAAELGQDLVTSYVAHGVANAFPTNIVDDLAWWIDIDGKPVDEQISDFAQYHDIPVVYLMPSIVDHRDADSVIPATDWQPRTKGRTAHRFLL